MGHRLESSQAPMVPGLKRQPSCFVLFRVRSASAREGLCDTGGREPSPNFVPPPPGGRRALGERIIVGDHLDPRFDILLMRGSAKFPPRC